MRQTGPKKRQERGKRKRKKSRREEPIERGRVLKIVKRKGTKCGSGERSRKLGG